MEMAMRKKPSKILNVYSASQTKYSTVHKCKPNLYKQTDGFSQLYRYLLRSRCIVTKKESTQIRSNQLIPNNRDYFLSKNFSQSTILSSTKTE